MKMINIHDLKTHLSKLINQALKGEEVIITRRGKPRVRLTVVTESLLKRKGGQLNGMLIFSEDFDLALPQVVLDTFYDK